MHVENLEYKQPFRARGSRGGRKRNNGESKYIKNDRKYYDSYHHNRHPYHNHDQHGSRERDHDMHSYRHGQSFYPTRNQGRGHYPNQDQHYDRKYSKNRYSKSLMLNTDATIPDLTQSSSFSSQSSSATLQSVDYHSSVVDLQSIDIMQKETSAYATKDRHPNFLSHVQSRSDNQVKPQLNYNRKSLNVDDISSSHESSWSLFSVSPRSFLMGDKSK